MDYASRKTRSVLQCPRCFGQAKEHLQLSLAHEEVALAHDQQDTVEHRVKTEMVQITRGVDGVAFNGFPDRQRARTSDAWICHAAYPDVKRSERSVT